MTTKELARQVLQKLHDAYNKIPDDTRDDFDHTRQKEFSKAMEDAMHGFNIECAGSRENEMRENAVAWAKTLKDKD